MLKGLTISRNGSYSGTVLINGGSHAISGKFNLAGQAISHISRPPGQGGPVAVTMTLNWNISPPQLTGIVAGTNTNQSGWEADLTAFYASNALPPAAYTMLIPPDNDNAPPCLSPGGYGYALITNQAGTARITGALADGTAFNQTVPVSQDGYVPVCANLYAGKGLLLGWINLELTNAEASNISGLTWIRPSRASGRYTNGFNNVLPGNQVLLSLWTNSPNSVLANLTNLSMRDTINDTNVLANMAVTTTAAGKVNGPLVIGAINLKTGQFKVTVGSGANKTNGCGAILLSEGAGGGYFLTKTNAQSIQLGP
jgi:hypothetical protein